MSSQNHKRSAIVLAVLLIAATTVVPMGAAAQETSGNDPIDDWLSSVDEENQEEDKGVFDKIKGLAPPSAVAGFAAADGQLDRIFSNPFRDVPTNQDTATEFDRAVASNNDTFERKINSETNVTTAYDTHAVIIAHEDSDSVPVYVVGDVKDGNLSNLRVLDAQEFNKTGREVDEHWVVEGDAAEDLPTLTEEIAERIQKGESVGKSYQSKLGGRYCSVQSPFSASIVSLEECDVRSTIWMDRQSVIEGGEE